MVEKTVEQDNEIARAQQISKQRQISAAFRDVFGMPGSRTVLGKVILDELVRFAGGDRLPANQLDSTGRVDALATWRKMGRCDVIAAINFAIEWRESNVDTSKSGA